jgi:hypothetical protein
MLVEYLEGQKEKSNEGILGKEKELKVNLFLCLTKHHAMRAYGGVEV